MARWKRGSASQGVRQAIAYAFNAVCDQTLTARDAEGVIAAAGYADALMVRYTVVEGSIRDDLLTRDQLKDWVNGADPLTGERRGRVLESPTADLILDATVNAPKSFSVAAMLHPEINTAFEALQDRLRDRTIRMWQAELNARRGAGGLTREALQRIEVVELRHERSRSLDPHKHRHLWLNVRAQGQDGRWSNIDTRVALRFQTLVNAEGDLAARTDPEWLAALAAHGYTLDTEGEIAQLTHLVRPLSRRSAQIEANKAARTAWWRQAHPGQEPDRHVLNAIDRWAWATGRPDKARALDEDEWADNLRAELAAIDPAAGAARTPAPVTSVRFEDLDLDLLAARAVTDADRRSTGTGGRFSVLDIRAGAVRALSASGWVGNRDQLDPVVKEVTGRALAAHTVDLVGEADVPEHVKARTATSTIAAKVALAKTLETLAVDGMAMPAELVTKVAETVDPHRPLDCGQAIAVQILAGTDRLVTVTGPAGTGKTTMLKVAAAALRAQGRRMVIVAPTKKAASVAGRETDVAASSLHQLLHDYGWRWGADLAGRTRWDRLTPGAVDPDTGRVYSGPQNRLTPDDRLVIDEAGMLDLDAALALMHIVKESGSGLAAVGDEMQALPVGHSGAMALMTDAATRSGELEAVHRFHDPAWADLTLRIRDPHGLVGEVAQEIIDTGHAQTVQNQQDAAQVMAAGWFQARGKRETIALVTSTQAEAQIVNVAIQDERIRRGQLDWKVATTGQSGQTLLVGDVVQTRRNDAAAGVANRDIWTITRIDQDRITLAAANDSSRLRVITHEYASRHVHLGYATTVHGIQGETTDRSLVGPGVDHAGLYVGLTRGRRSNVAIIVASSPRGASRQLSTALMSPTVEASAEDTRGGARGDLARASQEPRPPGTRVPRDARSAATSLSA